MKTVHDGKLDAGNPHVRFDEGEVALAATPRRGSLLYKTRKALDGKSHAGSPRVTFDYVGRHTCADVMEWGHASTTSFEKSMTDAMCFPTNRANHRSSMVLLTLCLACVSSVAALSSSAQTRWFVKPDGDPFADGLTWDTATTLSNAFARVTAGTAGTEVLDADWHEIVLMAGTPTSPAVYDFSAASAIYDDGKTLFKTAAAYVRVCSAAEDSDPRRVILRGGYDSNPMRCINVVAAMQVEGLTFRDFYVADSGGAICDTGDKCTLVRNCVFEHNFSTTAGGAIAFGGLTPVVTNCVFHNNRCTTARGGAAVKFGTVCGSTMTSNSGTWAACYSHVYDSRLVENLGGVFYCVQAYDCSILSNRLVDATSYPLLYTVMCRNSGSDGTVGLMSRCYIEGNATPEITASFKTGGVTTETCRDCVFVGNDLSKQADWGHEGFLTNCVFTGYRAGTIIYNGTTQNCIFTNNAACIAKGGSHKDDIIMNNVCDGCLLTGISSTCTFEQCLIASNTVSSSLVETVAVPSFSLIACTIVDNVCGSEKAAVGLGFSNKYPPTVKGCIVSRNTPYDIWFNTEEVVTNSVFSTWKGTMGVTNGCLCVASSSVCFEDPDELHPYGYCPKRSNPAVDHGFDNGYTATSVDLTGVIPRVYAYDSDGKPDCGCYERMPKRPGLIVIVR